MATTGFKPVELITPIDGTLIREVASDDDASMDAVLTRAHTAQRAWRLESIEQRAAVLRKLAAELRESVEELAQIATLEMGKPIKESRAEVEKCAWVCDYCAEHGPSQLAPTPVQSDWTDTYVQYPPLGVVLAVMPWNFPFWQVLRAAAPIIMGGNTVVLKHASNVTGSAIALKDVFDRADVPASLLEVIVISGSRVAKVIHDERIAAVTLTGSEAVGIQVATDCAQVLKPSVLELGGSDAFMVLSDADVEAAAAGAAAGRFMNTGQSCIASKRFIVVESVADQFVEAFVAETGKLVVEDPRQSTANLGPMARTDLRDELLDQINRGVAGGGRVVLGGKAIDRPGSWIEPTIVDRVTPGNALAVEETFGPAAAVIRAKDDEDVIRLANDSLYGLSSSIWTADIDRAKRLSPLVQAGAVFVNTFSASDPRMPFGGVKRSGWGRELGAFGIKEFVNVQAVTVAPKRK